MTVLSFSAMPVQSKPDGSPDGWSCDEFRLLSSRSADIEASSVDVGADDVIELVLEDGSSILATEEDLPLYGFQPRRSGDGIEITTALAPPDALSRDGAARWVLRSLRLWRNPVGAGVHALAGSLQDKGLAGDGTPGWYRFGADAQALGARLEHVPSSNAPALLLIHGTISSTAGSFSGLLGQDSWPQLRRLYGDRVYGFEHRSLTDSPLDNALEAMQAFPDGLTVDVITHSRGGLVAELLVRAADPHGSPFDEQTIALHAKNWPAATRQEFVKKLSELQLIADRKQLTIRRLVRVAAPMRGTTLLSGRLDRWASITLNLAALGLTPWMPAAPAYANKLREFLLAITKQRADATVLPGLEAMRPESPWMALLNPPSSQTVRLPTFVIAGDYRGQGIGGWLADRFSDVYYGGGNDWVVNTASMTGGAVRSGGLRRALFKDPETKHTTYFNRGPVRQRIFDALEHGVGAANFELIKRESTTIARGGRKPEPKPGAPIAFLLPGITGSHLQVKRDRIWLQFREIIFGNLNELEINAKNVSADGWIDSAYDSFADFLTQSHELRPFAYDWRLSIATSGALFAVELEKALNEADTRNQPVHIFAHSLGGLVARAALSIKPELWDRLEARSGSRLVMLGTPNLGSHSIPWLLMGQEKTLRKLARADLRHGRRELVDFFRHFPGVLELMPHGEWGDRNYFDPSVWSDLTGPLKDKDGDWPVPDTDALGDSSAMVERIRNDALAGRPVAYVAGFNGDDGTIEALGLNAQDGRFEPRRIKQGDGRVLWSSGIPAGVPTYFVDATHGDLADHRSAFEGYLELAQLGRTSRLSSSPPLPLNGRDLVVDRGFGTAEPYQLFPTEDEVIAAALGRGAPEQTKSSSADAPRLRIRLTHGSFVAAHGAMLIGRYENDVELRGTMLALDEIVGGVLSDALALNQLPHQINRTFIGTNDGPSDLGAIVVGLGRLGDLNLGQLQQTVKSGILQYVLQHARRGCDGEGRPVHLGAILIGSGAFGLGIHAATQALLTAAGEAQEALIALRKHSPNLPLIDTLQLFEIDEIRAEEIAAAIHQTLQSEPDLPVRHDGRIERGEHGSLTYLSGAGTLDSAQRAVIKAPDGIEAGLEFTILTRSARSDFLREPGQGKFVSQMLRLATGSTQDHKGLSRALFELLTPNDYKPLIGNVESLVLSVDKFAAAIPWELMRDPNDRDLPLAARVKLVRQLVRSPKTQTARSLLRRALIIGDTDTGQSYPALPGARQELATVNELFRARGYETTPIPEVGALELLHQLLVEEYGILHIAAHGAWEVDDDHLDARTDGGQNQSGVSNDRPSRSGIVLSDGLLLTSRQIAKLPKVPELVFLNCCHLGNTSADAKRQDTPWPELASSLAIAFIDRGAKAVVAAGWAVDDQAAHAFASSFYRALLDGKNLGTAALAARKDNLMAHPNSNTWGAYQVYGDDQYVFTDQSGKLRPPTPPPLLTRLAALDAINGQLARIRNANRSGRSEPDEDTRKRLDPTTLFERLSPELRQDAEVRVALANAFKAAKDRPAAIEHLQAALELEPANVSLQAIEQLANMQVRHAEEVVRDTLDEFSKKKPKPTSKADKQPFLAPIAAARALFKSGTERIRNVSDIAPNRERYCLLGSAHKRAAQIAISSAPLQGKKESDPIGAIDEAIEAYEKAANFDALPPGEMHYYPANNLVQLRWLKAVIGTPTAAATKKIEDDVEAAFRHAERCIVNGGGFWDLGARVDCALSQALTDEFNSSGPRAAKDIASRLLTAVDGPRRDLQRRYPNDFKNDSAKEQLIFMQQMLEHAAMQDTSRIDIRSFADALQLLIDWQSDPPGTHETTFEPPGAPKTTAPASKPPMRRKPTTRAKKPNKGPRKKAPDTKAASGSKDEE